MRIWNWAREKITSARSTISKKISEVSPKIKSAASFIFSSSAEIYRYVSKVIGDFLTDNAVKKFVFAVTKQGWFGFGRVLHFTSTTVLFDKPKTREIIGRHAFINSQQLGYIIANGITLQALVDYLSTTQNVYGKGTFYTLYALNKIGQVFAYSVSSKLLYENMMINVSASTIITAENPDLTNEHYKSCGHDAGAMLSAGMESVMEYYTALGLLKILSYVPGLYYATWLAEIFINGRSMTELKYASLGTCAEDRRKILKELNAFAAGVGISFEFFTAIACLGIQYLFGIDPSLTRSTVQTILYPYFAAAIVMTKDPIPPFDENNTKPKLGGRDYLWFARYIKDGLVAMIMSVVRGKNEVQVTQANTNKALKSESVPVITSQQISENETKSLQEKQDNLRIKAWLNYLQDARNYVNQKLTHYPKLNLMKYVLCFDPNNDWSTVESFLANYENKLFFDTYYQVTCQQLQGIKELREKSFAESTWREVAKKQAVRIIPGLPNWFSNLLVSPEYKALLANIMSDKLEHPLNDTIVLLKQINNIQKLAVEREEQAKRGAITFDAEAMARAAEAARIEEAKLSVKKPREQSAGYRCENLDELEDAIINIQATSLDESSADSMNLQKEEEIRKAITEAIMTPLDLPKPDSGVRKRGNTTNRIVSTTIPISEAGLLGAAARRSQSDFEPRRQEPVQEIRSASSFFYQSA